jgi:hypothetical protein
MLIALDQFVYVLITLGKGDPDETMSAAAYRLEQRGRLAGRIFRPVLDTLFWFDPQHCKRSYEAELERARLFLNR